jgi:hypothetical protein
MSEKHSAKRKAEYMAILGSEDDEIGVRVDKGSPGWKAWLAYLRDRKLMALHRHMMGKGPDGFMWLVSEYPPGASVSNLHR